MADPTSPPRLIRFDGLEVDLRAGELRKQGQRIVLQEQPLQILAMLLERPGEIVTREEIRRKLWPHDTIVEFDHSINAAIQRLRQALGDSADNPHFVETLARRGYRFIAPVEALREPPLRRHWRLAVAGGSMVVLVLLALALNVAGLRDRVLGTAAPKIESIAVLPLKNLSGDPEQEYFADGMTDALITELGKVSALRVISIQSMLQYKGTAKPIPQIAGELNVDALMEGSVLRSGERVRINAQLVQAKPERHLWSESFERDLRDVLALQSDLAQAIVREIKITATPEQRASLASARPVKPEAYEAFLKGRQFFSRWPQGQQRAIEYFQQAIEKDPTYAPAYAALAGSYAAHTGFSYDEYYPRARVASSKALQLDDYLAEAHCAEAYVDFRFRWDWAEAERGFRRALQLNPSSSECQGYYGFYLTLMGRFEEGIAAQRRAIALDPFNRIIRFMLTWHYMMAHRFDDAIAEVREVLELYPDFPLARGNLALAYAHKGMYREALAEAGGSAWVHAMSGGRKEVAQHIAELKRASNRRYVDPGFLAIPYALMGDKEQALEWLEEGYRVRARWMMYIKVVPLFDNLRSDPRFQDLLHRMNFPE